MATLDAEDVQAVVVGLAAELGPTLKQNIVDQVQAATENQAKTVNAVFDQIDAQNKPPPQQGVPIDPKVAQTAVLAQAIGPILQIVPGIISALKGGGAMADPAAATNQMVSTIKNYAEMMSPFLDIWNQGMQSGVHFVSAAARATGQIPDSDQFRNIIAPPPASPILAATQTERQGVADLAGFVPPA